MTAIDRRTLIASTAAALAASAMSNNAQAAPPGALSSPDTPAVPVSALTAPLRVELAELQTQIGRVTVFLDQIDSVEAANVPADPKSMFRWMYAFELGSVGRLMAHWTGFVAENVRALHYAAIESEKQFGRLHHADTRIRADQTANEIAAVLILREAGLTWGKAAELIFHEPALAELVARAMEARERALA